MKTKIQSRFTVLLSVAASIFICESVQAQSAAEWNTYRQQNGIDAHWAYNDWVAAGCPRNGGSAPAIPAGPTPQQQMQLQGAQMIGSAIGNALGQALWGSPADQARAQAEQQAQQQRQLAAQQLNNSGLYLFKQKNYAGAINEFQQALAQTPSDQNIVNNIALAKQKLKDVAVAAKNSDALGQLLGNNDLTHSSMQNPNASALGLVNLDSDPNVVDLRSATKTSVDPASLKKQINDVFANDAPASAPPNPLVQLPEVKDIELLFDPPQPAPSQWPGPQHPANEPKLVNPISSSSAQIYPDKLPKDSDINFLFPGLPAKEMDDYNDYMMKGSLKMAEHDPQLIQTSQPKANQPQQPEASQPNNPYDPYQLK